MRIVLCENGLRSAVGHHYNLAAGLKDELAARGVPLVVWTNTSIDEGLRRALGATALFERSPYDASPWRSRPSQIGTCVLGALSFRSGLRRGGVRRGDVLIVPTARPAEIFGLAAFLGSGAGKPSAAAVNFMLDDFSPALLSRNPALQRFLYRTSVALLRARLPRNRLVLSCQSAALARSVGAAGRVEVAVYPMLKAYPALADRHPSPGSPTIGFLGAPRPEKGEQLLPDLVEQCARSFPGSRVVVQLRDPTRGDASWPSNVEVLPVRLPRPRYFELLRRIDVVVLPYDRRTFGSATSGVFTEGVAGGCVAVVPTGTWMADMLAERRGAGVVFEQHSVGGVAGAVERAVRSFDRLRSLALAAAPAWRETQTCGAYVDRLLADLRAQPSVSSRSTRKSTKPCA